MASQCTIKGCSRPRYGRGLCSPHYQRWRRHGDPFGGRPTTQYAPVCSVEGCDRPHLSRGFCVAHYNRWATHGDPGPAEIQRFRIEPDSPCKVEDCAERDYSLGYCTRHYRRLQVHGDPHQVDLRTGVSNPNWGGDKVRYNGAHHRVRSLYGSASNQSCRHCGGRAAQWAYDHADPDERTSDDGMAYSTDPDHYMPLCVPCHRAFDRRVVTV